MNAQLVPIYQYSGNDPARFLYSKNPDVGHGWKNEGVAFQVFRKQLGGPMVPIYQYHANDPARFLYSQNPNFGHGWSKDDIVFYALKQTFAGAVPIYGYSANDPGRFYLSRDPNVGHGWTNVGIAFYALPKETKPTMTVTDIKYAETKPPKVTTPVDIMSHETIRNPSGAEITQQIDHSLKKSSIFEWGLKETLQVGVSAKFEAGIPFIGSGEVEINVSLGLEAHQKWTKSVEETYAVKRTVKVPAHTSIEVDAYTNWADDFTSDFRLFARYSVISEGGQFNNDQLKELLDCMGFQGRVDDRLNDELIVSVTGTFSGSYGMGIEVDVKPLAAAMV